MNTKNTTMKSMLWQLVLNLPSNIAHFSHFVPSKHLSWWCFLPGGMTLTFASEGCTISSPAWIGSL